MKSFIVSILCVFCSGLLDAQTHDTLIKYNTLFLEYYQPIFSPLSDKFYIEDLEPDPSNYGYNSMDHYNSNDYNGSIGLGYERMLQDSIMIRSRIGMSLLKHSSSGSTDKYPDGIQEQTHDYDYVYKQVHLNLFLGVAKRFMPRKNFQFDLGIDIPFILYLGSAAEYNYHYKYYWFGTNDVFGTNDLTWIVENGKSFGVGIGPYLKPEFIFKNGLCISFELQTYFMFSSSKTYTRNTTRDRSWLNEIANGGYEYNHDLSSVSLTELDLKKWGFSNISPLLRIGYKF